jgi:membrane associated rhomboid family serine protease
MFPLRDDRATPTEPVVTVLLIAACSAVFLHEILLDEFSRSYFIDKYAMVPAHLRLSTLVTSQFVHAGWWHIIGNMVFLWAFGRSIEDALGHMKFLGFYILSGIGAGLVHVAFNYYSRTPTVGASGAIAGIMGAYLLRFPRAHIHTLLFILIFVTVVDIPAPFFVLYWFITQVFNGYGSIARTQVSEAGTAYFAHIGGFLTGMFLISTMGTRKRYLRNREDRW